MKVKVTKTDNSVTLPEYKTEGASGMDVQAFIPLPEEKNIDYVRAIIIPSGECRLIPTGLKVEIPEGYEIQVRPRSGLALKNQITVLNTPGTIDSDYRGEIGVILMNHGKNDFAVIHGERVAQLVFCPVAKMQFVESKLAETERGEGGFGSTGK